MKKKKEKKLNDEQIEASHQQILSLVEFVRIYFIGSWNAGKMFGWDSNERFEGAKKTTK